MELSSKHLKVSFSFFLVYVEVIALLSFFNLQGLNLVATPVISGNDTDKQALLEFKGKITGDQLKVMHSWNSSIHFCQWYGVTCGRRHQRVTSGEIPSNLSGCSKLTFVHMRGNLLTGEIPGSVGLLSNLKFLSLTNNSLRGSIPPSLGNLSSLEKLSLPMNRLSGVIPEALGQLKNLSFFSVAVNVISGTVPVSIFNLSNIRAFDIGINKIQGTLPSNLGITMPYIEIFSVM
ncbi:hypothetical protein REPUB_Repub13aG0096600 [Reevesia pubescens]